MGSYSVEESRDRIIERQKSLALTAASEAYRRHRQLLVNCGLDKGDIENEAFVLLLEIVDGWDRESPFDSFCESELKRRLRNRVNGLTKHRRKYGEQTQAEFRDDDRPEKLDDEDPDVALYERLELVEARLTADEFLVARKAADGFTDIEIKEQLGVHRTTVSKRRESALRKLSQIKGELYE